MWDVLRFGNQENDARRLDRLFSADRSNAFAGLSLQADLLWLDSQDIGQPLLDQLSVRQQFGPLSAHNTIEIDYPPTEGLHGIEGRAKHFGRVSAAVRQIGIGEHLPDITQGGRTEQGVGDGVQQHVSVTMTDKFPVVGNVDPPQA